MFDYQRTKFIIFYSKTFPRDALLTHPKGQDKERAMWARRQTHDDVIKLKHFRRNWPFERGIHRPVTRSFDVSFDLRPNKRLRKQSWGWWFETLLRPLWRHCNACVLHLLPSCAAHIQNRYILILAGARRKKLDWKENKYKTDSGRKNVLSISRSRLILFGIFV